MSDSEASQTDYPDFAVLVQNFERRLTLANEAYARQLENIRTEFRAEMAKYPTQNLLLVTNGRGLYRLNGSSKPYSDRWRQVKYGGPEHTLVARLACKSYDEAKSELMNYGASVGLFTHQEAGWFRIEDLETFLEYIPQGAYPWIRQN